MVAHLNYTDTKNWISGQKGKGRLPYRVLLEKCQWIQTPHQICRCLLSRSCASCSTDTLVFLLLPPGRKTVPARLLLKQQSSHKTGLTAIPTAGLVLHFVHFVLSNHSQGIRNAFFKDPVTC